MKIQVTPEQFAAIRDDPLHYVGAGGVVGMDCTREILSRAGVDVPAGYTGQIELQVVQPFEVPHSVVFFPNGMAAVCNADGEQIGKFQGRHAFTVEALKAAGYEWSHLPEVLGVPS